LSVSLEEKVVELKLLFAVAAASVLTGLTAHAHHSFTATYDENQTVEIKGTLVQFMFRNPHAWVHVMAPGFGWGQRGETFD
jgi:hypothetical protein